MPEIPDFSHYEHDDEPLRGFTHDDMDFLANLAARANALFDSANSSELGLCKESYTTAIEQRVETITRYMQASDDAELAAYVKAGEAQLYTLFCEYIDTLLHAPSGYGPLIMTEITAALTMADTSQMAINRRTGEEHQFAQDKLQEAIMHLVMAAHGGAETQHVLQELYKKHIHDVVVHFVDNESHL